MGCGDRAVGTRRHWPSLASTSATDWFRLLALAAARALLGIGGAPPFALAATIQRMACPCAPESGLGWDRRCICIYSVIAQKPAEGQVWVVQTQTHRQLQTASRQTRALRACSYMTKQSIRRLLNSHTRTSWPRRFHII